MKKISSAVLSLCLFCSALPAAFAAETVPTTNQPDNGFFEGPDPEWSTLHSTDSRGTPEHRQYHRDAVKAHFDWHEENTDDRMSSLYARAHRAFHQLRNLLHRQFHSAPVDA